MGGFEIRSSDSRRCLTLDDLLVHPQFKQLKSTSTLQMTAQDSRHSSLASLGYPRIVEIVVHPPSQNGDSNPSNTDAVSPTADRSRSSDIVEIIQHPLSPNSVFDPSNADTVSLTASSSSGIVEIIQPGPLSPNDVSDPSRSHTATVPSTTDTDSSFGTDFDSPGLSPFYRALLANVDEQDILDKSKTDSFSKAIALCQILWFLTACIARSIDHLPVTPLEIMTIAFATLNVIMYLIWWQKPLNVQRPIIIHASNLSDLQPDQAEQDKWSLKYRILRMIMNRRSGSSLEAGELSDPVSDPVSDHRLWLATAVSTIMAMIFGAVHMAAWNSRFPSLIERMLWSCSALIAVIVPMLCAVIWSISYSSIQSLLQKRVTMIPLFKLFTFFQIYALPLLTLLYILARLLLLVLPFILLRDLPPASYCTISWTQYLPHFSGS